MTLVAGKSATARGAVRATALLLATLLVTAPARATSPPAPAERTPSHMLGPVIARATELRVESARLAFVYADGARDRLAFEARYTVVNPSSVREDLAIAFYHWDVADLRVTVDGSAPLGAPTDDELKALELSQSAPAGGLFGLLRRAAVSFGATGPHPERVAFRLAAEPGVRHEIVISGRVEGQPQHDAGGLEIEPVVARHVLLGSGPPEIDRYIFGYDLVPSGDWKDVARVDVSITYPSRWVRPDIGRNGVWGARREGATTVLRSSMSPKEAGDLQVAIDSGYSRLRNGGPLLGIGGTFGSNPAVRGRLGYEVAAPAWLLYSLTADTDFHKRVLVTPMVEAASPAVLILPSAGVGVGVPVQVAPDPRVGVRLQGDIQFYPLGFVTSLDVFPPLGSRPTSVDVSLLGQVAF